MKKKIFVIFVSIVMFSTVVTPVSAITDKYNLGGTSNDANVPVWEVGYEWTYHFIESRSHMVSYILSGDLTLKVVEDIGDSYILEANTKPKGIIDLGGFGLKTTRLSSLFMRLQIRKSDLALEKYLYKIKGLFFIKVGLITLPIPIQVEGNTYVEFDPSWVIMPFPLYDGKSGILNGTELLHMNIYFSLFWGLVSVYGPQNYSYPHTPLPYTCTDELITVEAGTFNVYNVSAEWMDGSRYVSYFSEDVKNVAKEVIFRPFGGGRVQYSLILELKDWSYTP